MKISKKLVVFLAGLAVFVASAALIWSHPVAIGLGMTRVMMRVQGMTQNFESTGDFEVSFFEKDAHQPQTVVLIHGLADQAGTWWQIIDVLEGYHVIAVELPGHGDSGPTEGEIDIAMFRKSVDLVMKRSHGPAILIGNSLGGYVALQYALEHPESVARVVAIDAAGMPMKIDSDVFMPKDRTAMAATLLKVTGPSQSSIPDFILDDIRDNLLRGATPRVWRALLDGGPLDAELGKLSVPTDVIWGDQDGLIPVQNGREMAKIIPGATYAEIPGCGHSPQASCPEALTPILSRILSGSKKPN